MNKIVLNTGKWAAIICLISFIIWIISFTGIAISSPLFMWTNLEGYIDFVNNNNQFFQYLAKSFIIVFSLSYMVLVFAFYESVVPERRILAKIALAFSIMFALVSSMHYFVQISAVRFALGEGIYSGLEHFLQARPTSVMTAINMLGWTLFLGLSSFFIYLSYRPDKKAKVLKVGLLINAISCLLAGAGYLFQIDLLTFVSINIGVGGAFLVITISSIRYLKRLEQD
ncbi:MAG: hypothetical protein JW798_17270 [Prolixibacteraceae bacterium]|nr:hypothetical protein [Prolixibacteraceae bacterium]